MKLWRGLALLSLVTFVSLLPAGVSGKGTQTKEEISKDKASQHDKGKGLGVEQGEGTQLKGDLEEGKNSKKTSDVESTTEMCQEETKGRETVTPTLEKTPMVKTTVPPRPELSTKESNLQSPSRKHQLKEQQPSANPNRGEANKGKQHRKTQPKNTPKLVLTTQPAPQSTFAPARESTSASASKSISAPAPKSTPAPDSLSPGLYTKPQTGSKAITGKVHKTKSKSQIPSTLEPKAETTIQSTVLATMEDFKPKTEPTSMAQATSTPKRELKQLTTRPQPTTKSHKKPNSGSESKSTVDPYTNLASRTKIASTQQYTPKPTPETKSQPAPKLPLEDKQQPAHTPKPPSKSEMAPKKAQTLNPKATDKSEPTSKSITSEQMQEDPAPSKLNSNDIVNLHKKKATKHLSNSKGETGNDEPPKMHLSHPSKIALVSLGVITTTLVIIAMGVWYKKISFHRSRYGGHMLLTNDDEEFGVFNRMTYNEDIKSYDSWKDIDY